MFSRQARKESTLSEKLYVSHVSVQNAKAVPISLPSQAAVLRIFERISYRQTLPGGEYLDCSTALSVTNLFLLKEPPVIDGSLLSAR
jgi:hypothetical protein